ncbi:hypothetical protein VZH09_07355 [Synechococcus elongatus IITB7]|uniref:hypothetical protein n=1 Tax=Synechococcus elongatus TaxID=32046 RepID=UPI0030CE326E
MSSDVEKQLKNIVETVKFVLRDTRELSSKIQALEQDLADTRDRLIRAEEIRASGAVPVSPAIATSVGSEPDQLLDLPLAKVLDLYGEVPQILVPYCRRAVIDREQNPPFLERNSQGNYWVLQLRDQGLLLLPRPGAFNRLAALESLSDLFDCIGERREDGTDEFCVMEPARLTLIKRHQRWQLASKGKLQFGSAPLEHRWRQQLQQIEAYYAAITQTLENQGVAGLQIAIAQNNYAQELHQRYGSVKRVLVNTCMPMAYARYRDAEENAWLVPCSVQMVPMVKVYPAWDAGVPWETTQFDEAEIVRASVENSALPGQAFLRDGSQQTWAIANSYEEASTLIDKLIGKWGPLFEPS